MDEAFDALVDLATQPFLSSSGSRGQRPPLLDSLLHEASLDPFGAAGGQWDVCCSCCDPGTDPDEPPVPDE